MLKRYAAYITAIRSIIDIGIIAFIWNTVYFVRFHLGIFSTPKGIPDFGRHLRLTLPIVFICYVSCLIMGVYKPKRTQKMFLQFSEILRVTVTSGLFIVAFLYYIQDHPYSRKLLVLFIVMLFIGLVFSHLVAMALIRRFRKKGYNLRRYVVIGTGKKGQQLVQDIERNSWYGLKCVFFVDDNPDRIGHELLGVPIYGPLAKLPDLARMNDIDEVYLALDGGSAQAAYPFLEKLQSTGVTVRIIPDWGNLISTNTTSLLTIGSQALFSAADSPLSGTNIILKEIFDRVIAATLLFIAFPIPCAVIALLIKLSSKGPVFYRQTRVGLDQREFKMVKFRTMIADAEMENDPTWARQNDSRRTRIGAWLRKRSLDELPQLMNVLKGELSLVGPRPERPYFVRQFSEEYKKYMLRHKVKAGMTGWAQVNGFRGCTSLRKRLQYDLYYVRNWSLALDLRILLMTPWQVIKGKNAG